MQDQVGRTAPRLFEVGVVPRCHVTTFRALPSNSDDYGNLMLQTCLPVPLLASLSIGDIRPCSHWLLCVYEKIGR